MIEPATEKQLKFIKAIEETLGYATFTGSTKDDASEWIEEYIDDFYSYNGWVKKQYFE